MRSSKLCIVGDPDDLSACYIKWLAERRGAEVLLLAENRFGEEWAFCVADGGEHDRIEVGGTRLPLSGVAGAFVRLDPRPGTPARLDLPDDAEAVYAIERRSGLHWLLDTAPFPVVNRPHAGRSNASKPYQMLRLAEAGFSVPAWVVTNDASVAQAFFDAQPHGAVYKACSGLRSHVRRAGEELLDRLAAGTAPVVIQRYVPGSDVRVHVVGGQVMATEIRSASVDYRFDGEDNRYSAVGIPDWLGRLCVAQCAREGLLLGGFDFRKDPDGGWFCLELNPVPTFLPYEAATGHPIGDAVLDLLGLPPSAPDRASPLAGLSLTEAHAS